MLADADWLALCDAATREAPLQRGRLIVEALWPGDDVDADTPGKRNRRMIALRKKMFGRHLACIASCYACGELLDLALDTQELLTHADGTDSPVRFKHAGIDYSFRLPTQRDVAEALKDGGMQALAGACLLEGDAEALNEPALLDAVSIEFERADPLGYLAVGVHCPQCFAGSELELDVGELLWDELRDMADQLTGQVHALASAYGWSEAAILALPPERRRRYIELVGE
jgi:hypothetical protein